MALLLLGGLVAVATILAGVYALCIRFSGYRRLSKGENNSTERLITSTEVSIYDDDEGRQRERRVDKEDNRQSRTEAELREKALGDRDQRLQASAAGEIKIGKDQSESAESSEIGDQESKPLLAGSGPREAAKYGVANEVNAQVSVPRSHSDSPAAKEKQGGFTDNLVEIEGQIKSKLLETSTPKDGVVGDINTLLIPTEIGEPPKGTDELANVSEIVKPQKSEPLETSSAQAAGDDVAENIRTQLLTIETSAVALEKGQDMPADASEIESQKQLEPLIEFSTAQTAKDGMTDALLLPAQMSELQMEKSGSMDTSSKIEMENSAPGVKTSASPASTEEPTKESITDKLNALFQPKLQKETEDLNEKTQIFPPMTRSPPPPHVAPKPAPRKSRAPDSTSPRPKSSASPGAPPVAAKPVMQAREHAFSTSAVPVLPMAFGKGGASPPALRRKAEVSNGEERQLPQMGGRLQMRAMFNGGFSTRGSEGGSESPSSFDEPTKSPSLYSPSKDRIKGPSNRRLPSRHSS